MKEIQFDNSNFSSPPSTLPLAKKANSITELAMVRLRRISKQSKQSSEVNKQTPTDSFSFEREDQPVKKGLGRLKYKQNVIKKKPNKPAAGQKKNKSELPELQGTIANYRLKNIQNQFISKLKRNSVFRQPIEFQQFAVEMKRYEQAHQRDGLVIDQKFLNAFQLINIVNTILACVLASLIIPFTDIFEASSFLPIFSIYGTLYTAFEMVMGFTLVREDEQKKAKLVQIAKQYLTGNFPVDLLCFLAYLICTFIPVAGISLSYTVFLLKIPECIRRMNELQPKIITTFKLQHYFSLFKLILYNFTFAHIIAIILLMMSHFDEGNNWLTKLHFTGIVWYQQYSWAYYWAMTTMLSVGFGDISVANYREALVLTVIEAFGYITLAYNITCVINLINSLEEKETWKNRNVGLLKKIKSKSQIEAGIYQQLTNFIKESHEIELKFNREPIVRMLEKLPENLKNGFLRSVNEKSIRNLPFFCNLTNKTIINIAQKIETKVAHPEELLISKEEMCNRILILKEGEIGLFPYFGSQAESLKCQAFDRFMVKEGQPSKLFSLDFLRPFYSTKNYEYKPLKYSLLLQISLPNLLQILRAKPADIELYYENKDKDCKNLEQFQVKVCQTCTENSRNTKQNESEVEGKQIDQEEEEESKCARVYKHSKFECCRLHYCPIPQQVIFKHLHRLKTERNCRKRMSSLKLAKKIKISALKEYKYLVECTNEFTQSFKTALRSIQFYNTEFLDYFDVCNQGITDEFPKMPSLTKLQIPPPIYTMTSRDEQLENWQKKNCSFMERGATMRKRVPTAVPSSSFYWDLECDLAYDFRFYLTANNPKKLRVQPANLNCSNRGKTIYNPL